MRHKSTTRDVTSETNPRPIGPTPNRMAGKVKALSPTHVPETGPRPTPRGPALAEAALMTRNGPYGTPVSGFGGQGIKSREPPKPTFTLPDKVSAATIKAESFRYGGGRSAGNRSMQANFDRKRNEP
jgi:hypothetical protein